MQLQIHTAGWVLITKPDPDQGANEITQGLHPELARPLHVQDAKQNNCGQERTANLQQKVRSKE